MSSGTLTIVIAGPREPSVDVESILDRWVDAGLIQPPIWVDRKASWEAGESGLTGRLLGSTEPAPTKVVDALARRNLETVRLVSAHLCVSQETDQLVNQHAAQTAQTLRWSLAPSQHLDQLSLIVPASGVAGLDPQLVTDPGVKHLIVSPEDRTSDRQTSRDLSWPDGGYAEHAALAIATMAGLWWSTAGSAPFDGEQFTGSAERSQLVVFRSFARILRTDALSEEVTRELFRRRRFEAWTISAVDGVEAQNPEQMVGELADSIAELDNSAMDYRPASPLPRPEQQRIGILGAFRMLTGFLVGKLAQAPRHIASRVTEGVRKALENFAQEATFGEHSSVSVGFGGRARRGLDDRFPSMLAADQATQLLRDLRRNLSQPATAELWRGLRQVAFGLVDAGPFPQTIVAPTDGARRIVVNDVSHVVADPKHRFVLDEAVLRSGLQLPEWAIEPIPTWDVGRLKALRSLLSESDCESAEQAPTTSPPPPPGGAATSSPLLPPPPPPRKPEPTPDSRTSLEVLLGDLDNFAREHRGSLLWDVSDALSASLGRASSAFNDALKRIGAGAPETDVDKMHLAARWLRRRVFATLLTVAVLYAIAWVGDIEGWWSLQLAPRIAAAAGILLVGWFLSFLGYQRRVFRIQHEFDQRHYDYLSAVERVEHEASETVRLASLYEQFLDWSAIIAAMVHRPEGHLDPLPVSMSAPPVPTPLALRIVEGLPSQDTLRRSSAVVGRRVFGPRWLGTLYGEYARASMQELKRQLGLDLDTPDPDPDRDIIGSPTPRRCLRHDVESGAQAHLWHAEVRTQVETELTQLPPSDVFESLAAVDTDDRAPEMTPNDFLNDLLPFRADGAMDLLDTNWTDDAKMQHPNPTQVHRSIVWAPANLVEIPASDTGEDVDIRPAALLDSGSTDAFSVSVVRCDASRGCPASDLSFFKQPDDAEHSDAFDSSIPG